MPAYRGIAFNSTSVEEVFLPRAPLALALAQVRFPQSPELHGEDTLARMRDSLKADYPIMREDKAVGFLVTPGGLTEGPPVERIVRFKDKPENWQFSVGQNFMSLDTTAYTTREDFASRFEKVVAATANVASPIVFDRIGIRYINRFVGEDLGSLRNLIAEPFLGLTSLDLTPASIVLSFTQSVLHLEEANVNARWGLLPKGTAIDTALATVEVPSWILDVDVYQDAKGDFVPAEIGRRIRRYAEVAYSFFRLAVTDELIRNAGGQL
jgi:uncharacterized protein (TIGR04255 family)